MRCPRCSHQAIVEQIDEKTSKVRCGSCGYSQIVETQDGQPSDRRLLTDDGPLGGGPLNG